jgi:thiosulfate/3-mercaptopyruvate sulfurtransferase
MPMSRSFIAFAVALSSFFAVGCGSNKFEQQASLEEKAVTLARQTEAGGYDLITTGEVKKLVDAKADVVIVDAMPYDESYAKGHIPGAVCFEFPKEPTMTEWSTEKTGGKTEADYEKLLGEDKDKPVIVYCGYVECGRSHNAAVWAKKLGYTDVKRHPGGIFAWKGRNYPTAKPAGK